MLEAQFKFNFSYSNTFIRTSVCVHYLCVYVARLTLSYNADTDNRTICEQLRMNNLVLSHYDTGKMT